MLGHLLALIPRQRAAQLRRKFQDLRGQLFVHLLRMAPRRQRKQHHEAGLALHQGADRRVARLAEQQIALPGDDAPAADAALLRPLDRPNRCRTRPAAEQRHLPKCVPGTELGNGVAGHRSAISAIRHDFDPAARDDEQRIAGISDAEHDLPGFDVAGAHARKRLLDLFGRQMAQKIALRQQPDELLRLFLLALKRVFAKPRRVADGSALLLEKEGRRISREWLQRRSRRRQTPRPNGR